MYSPRSRRARRASTNEAKNAMVSFTIPSKLFKVAHKESQSTPSTLRLVDRHLTTLPAPGTDKRKDRASVAENHWRQMLVSPLVGFLTEIRNNTEWVQLAGHQGNFLPGRGGTICKKWDEGEQKVYEGLMDEGEPLKEFVPLFFKKITVGPGDEYIELQDLLSQFSNPCVMDCKVGTRTFRESEVSKEKLRMDLLAKMMKLDPDEPTEEEQKNGITKLRYMVFREMLSSSRTLGFRIEGIKLGGEDALTTFKTKKSRADIGEVITEQYLPRSIGPSVRKKIQLVLRDRLEDLRDAADSSEYFQTHAFIGSSLLFVYDLTGHAGIWMIDFGKTGPTDGGRTITHREEWKLGNNEDGYLFGLDTMIDIFNDGIGD